MAKTLLACLVCLACLPGFSAQAFDLALLRQQMQQATVVRGSFVQEKYIRGLEQPLQSRGQFCLIQGKGLLWTLDTPIAGQLRISAQGVARRVDGTWQAAPDNAASRQQNALFLAVLQGDTAQLQQYFALELSGSAEDWQLRMVPQSALLQQIFTQIDLSGGAQVTRIELTEVSGERTRLVLQQVMTAATPSAEEVQAFDN